MVPANQEELLKPGLYAPGPLSRLTPGDPRLSSPLSLVRDLPEGFVERTRAIVPVHIYGQSADMATITEIVEVKQDGTVDYSCSVAGDGTVSAGSALNGGSLLKQSIEVDEGHVTLPLDGKAIEHTVDWIGQQFAAKSTRSSAQSWPPAPEIQLPDSRDGLLRHLEDDDGLTLGDVVALIRLV